ncbi:MAG TPA: DUF222 domain-containing protein [Nocardioides sp.]|uniref:DUF222 domain-containing protein n=1 Tax=Nocardioides sp. TaxID=35761 RepID=UPI002D7F9B7D|nr:DUF222 domain-containing protein [Nocardioides sp.]HET6652275.1 DUF222 domain-containing protein [Nocardioides sp.]
MEPVVDDLERRAVADALVSNHAALVEAECRELVLAAQWADLHAAESIGSGVVLPGPERARRYGGDGTPFAGAFAAAELGVLLGRSHVAAATLMADALDVRHRLPKLWAALTAGQVRVWQARHVASRTRATGLTLAQARQVDETTTPYLTTLPWGRFVDLLEARIIAADPDAAEQRRIAAELDRFVVTGQSNEHGLKTLVAKATAGEIIYLVAMVDRIAEILLQHGDTDPVGARRSKALGILAHPARALALLRSAVGDQVSTGSTTGGDQVPTGSTTGAVSTGTTTGELPPATLYVHVSRESMQVGAGVARMEGVGPITIGQASEFLRHSHVTIRPVIDLDQDRPVDGYEVPDRLRELVHLRSPASAFPWSSATGRKMDLDHTRPWIDTDTAGPPGQTRIENLGKLTRFEHRVKTHGRGWRHRQPEPGVHVWRTPTGYQFTVDHTGTHPAPVPETPDSAYERALAELLSTHARSG